MMIKILLILALLVPSFARAQSILPFTQGFFVNNSGALLAGGKICTTITGTSTNLATYPTAADAVAATNPNSNPVTLDAYGRASIFGNGTYRIIIYNSGTGNTCNGSAVGSAIKTIDGVVMSTVTTVSGTSNRIAKYTSASALGNSSIYDGFTGERIRIQTDGTVSIGTTSDIAAGLHVSVADTVVARFETTNATATLTLAGTGTLYGQLAATATEFDMCSAAGPCNTGYGVFPTYTTAFHSDAIGFRVTSSGATAGIGLYATGTSVGGLSGTTSGMSISLRNTGITLSGVAPTISSGFGTVPSVTGTAAAMRIDVGTGGSATAGVIGLPTAATGWNCSVENLTAVTANVANARTVQLSSTATTATIENQTISTGAALVWTAGDVLMASCTAY